MMEKPIDEKLALNKTLLERARRAVEKSKLSEANKKTLLNYYQAILANNGFRIYSNHTINDIIQILKRFGEAVDKTFDKMEKEDIEVFFSGMREKGFKTSTINEFVIKVKQFFRWLYQTEKYPDLVKNLKTQRIKNKVDSTKLLTPTEVKKLIKVNHSSRNRALIMGLYESGCRLSEFVGLKLKDIQFDEFGVKIRVSGKTGERNLRLMDSEPYFRAWLNEHPFKQNPEDYFFMSFASNYYRRQLKPITVYAFLKTSAKRVNIGKNVYPHLLRHSRLDYLAREGFNEKDLRIFAGWSAGSNMPEVYLHYGEDEVERKLLEQKGKLTPEKKKEREQENKALEPKVCPRCSSNNPTTALYCNCGQVLDTKEALKVDEKVKTETNKAFELLMEIAKNPQMMKEFEEFKTQLNKIRATS